MLHKLTPTQIMILLTHDHGFRQDAVRILNQPKESPLDKVKNYMRAEFPQRHTTQKIPAIKFIRTYVQDHQELVEAFRAFNYEVYGAPGYNHNIAQGPQTLGLAAAKKFVESF